MDWIGLVGLVNLNEVLVSINIRCTVEIGVMSMFEYLFLSLLWPTCCYSCCSSCIHISITWWTASQKNTVSELIFTTLSSSKRSPSTVSTHHKNWCFQARNERWHFLLEELPPTLQSSSKPKNQKGDEHSPMVNSPQIHPKPSITYSCKYCEENEDPFL